MTGNIKKSQSLSIISLQTVFFFFLGHRLCFSFFFWSLAHNLDSAPFFYNLSSEKLGEKSIIQYVDDPTLKVSQIVNIFTTELTYFLCNLFLDHEP